MFEIDEEKHEMKQNCFQTKMYLFLFPALVFSINVGNSIKCKKNITPPPHLRKKIRTRQLGRPRSPANNFRNEHHNVVYIYIGYRFPLSLSTIWGNHLPVNFMLNFPTCTGVYLRFGKTTSSRAFGSAGDKKYLHQSFSLALACDFFPSHPVVF